MNDAKMYLEISLNGETLAEVALDTIGDACNIEKIAIDVAKKFDEEEGIDWEAVDSYEEFATYLDVKFIYN